MNYTWAWWVICVLLWDWLWGTTPVVSRRSSLFSWVQTGDPGNLVALLSANAWDPKRPVGQILIQGQKEMGIQLPKRNQFSLPCPFVLLRCSVCCLNGAHPHKEAQTTLRSPESQMQPSYLETPSQTHPGRPPSPCQGTVKSSPHRILSVTFRFSL